MELTYYYNRIGDLTREYFVDIYPIKGLVVSGPGPTKEDFVKGGYLEYRLQNMIVATLDTSYAGAEGVREAFKKAGDALSGFRMVEERRLVDRLFSEVNSRSGLGAYGLSEVVGLLRGNVVGTLLVTDDTGLHRIESRCGRCGREEEEFAPRAAVIGARTRAESGPCAGCGAASGVSASDRDLVDYLSLVAAEKGARVEVVSGRAEHGLMLGSLGGVGAILRYNPGHSAAGAGRPS